MPEQISDLTLKNFTEKTKLRFRVTKEQRFLIQATDFGHKQRENILTSEATNEELANLYEVYPETIAIVRDANNNETLTREQAFEAYKNSGALDGRRVTTKEIIPLEVYIDPDLTVETFYEIVKKHTGKGKRLRLEKDLATQVKNKEISRAEALQITIERKKEESNE